MTRNPPRYLQLASSKLLEERINSFHAILEKCSLCPRNCQVNRLKDQLGFCQAGSQLRVAAWGPHSGEEPPVSGKKGAGNIFFSRCTMKCLYCQNYPISQFGYGNDINVKKLSQIMTSLQKKGCHNINLVTATPYLPFIVEALSLAVKDGLCLPIVYNSSGYETVETLRLLDGIIDIYLPDARYGSEEKALAYSQTGNYVFYNRLALQEMFRQVGKLKTDENGLAEQGIIIRHLVLPENTAETEKTLSFIVQNISQDIHISLMSQYFPAYQAHQLPPLNRKITEEEYENAFNILERLGFKDGWYQS